MFNRFMKFSCINIIFIFIFFSLLLYNYKKTFTMSAEYASLEVEKVVLHPIGVPAGDDAVSKTYVDTHVSTEIALLVDSAPGVLNTLKEIASALGNDANLAVTLANSISAETTSRTVADASIQSQLDALTTSSASALSSAVSTIGGTTSAIQSALTSETTLRDSEKTAIELALSNEVSARMSAISDMTFLISEESSSRVSADNAFDTRITEEKTRAEGIESGHDLRIASVEDGKLNKSGGTMTGSIVLQDSYIYFGTAWRVRASADGTRIEFQYKKTDTWKLALPFIAPA